MYQYKVIIKALHYETKKWRGQFLDGKKIALRIFCKYEHINMVHDFIVMHLNKLKI